MSKSNRKTVILTDRFPDLIGSEIDFWEKKKYPFVLFFDEGEENKKEEKYLLKLQFASTIGWIGAFLTCAREFASKEIKTYSLRQAWYEIKTFRTWWQTAQIVLQEIEQETDMQNISSVYSYWADPKALTACILGKKQGAKVVIRMHGWDLYEERHPYNFLPFRNFLIEHSDSLCFVSDQGRAYFEEKYPEAASKCRTERLGTRAPLEKEFIPEEKETFRIVSCSSIVAVKRLDKIFAVLEKTLGLSKIEWIHFGGGEELVAYQEEIQKKGLQEHFFFRGEKENEAIHQYYTQNQVDLFINLSDSEGLPVAMMEAISYGIPLFGLDVGGVSEILESEVNGQLMSADSTISDLVESLKQVISAPWSQQMTWRTNARKIWEEKFQAEKNFQAFYEGLLVK